MKRLAHSLDELDRRAFLRRSAAGLLGVGLAPDGLLPHPSRVGTARRVIYLYMSGGMSHLDTFDPKPGSEVMGPTEAIPTRADDVSIGAHFRNLAPLMDRVAVVSSMSSNQGAHVQGRYFMHTSYTMRGTIRHPTLGAWLSQLAGADNPTLPPHVAVGGDVYGASGGFLESRHYPLPIGNPSDGLRNAHLPATVSEERFHQRMDRLAAMNAAFEERYGGQKLVRSYAEAYDQAVELMRSDDLTAFDLEAEPEPIRAAYGQGRFGQGVLLARRLCERGVRFVEVTDGGWDTHVENFDAMDEKLPSLDQTLATLLLDLEARGMLEDTLVVLATEFGRTPEIVSGRNGRNHHPKAFSCLLAGGGIRGGQRYGQTDERGEEVVDRKVTVPDFNATIAHALGLDVEKVHQSPTGRPFQVADKGRPIAELFA
ncbi:MAG: DUF1501 domain-containing protein [Planctomycetota bacterium]|nr:DUF1501 domain-containing protein [Planctomycetota bacterium]MDA0933745.1 DUF1501 domain-containing protein [Planctomycetota bacterium]MDA1221855.1 DUF1501 domain-containing protein [Planctomycetota bacterium]